MKFPALFLIAMMVVSILDAQKRQPRSGSRETSKPVEDSLVLRQQPVEETPYEPLELGVATVFFIKVFVLSADKPDLKNDIKQNLAESVQRANVAFAAAGVRFETEGQVQFIVDKRFARLKKTDEAALHTKYCNYKGERMINLFCVDAIINEETGAEGESGRAYLPYVSERHLKEMVILSIEDGLHLTGTLAHELGHFFGLHHTHGDEKKFQKELANGSNCLVAGDSLCDTPADPGLQGRVIATDPCNCRYNGNQRDRFDDPYHPLADNIMSYAPDLCLRSFTPGQLNKISYYARWRRAQFRHYYDRENKNAWMPGEYAADLVTAKEDFGLSQRKQYALMIVYHPANTWSQRLIKDLAQPSTRKIIETYDYKVVFFNVARQGKSLADYFGNHVLPQSLQESFQRLLRPGTVLVPAIFVIKFDKDREKTEVSSNFGYMNPRTLSQMLVEKGRRRTVLSK